MGLCLIKALVPWFVVLVVVLLCKRLFRCIPCNFAKQRSAKDLMAHSLGTVQPTRKTADLDLVDIKRHIG
jgi:hypothetical protein